MNPNDTRTTAVRAGLAAALSIVLSAIPVEAQERGTTLRLQVSSFRNTTGTLNCRLFSQSSAFPDGEGTKTVRVSIHGAEATCSFDDLAPGTYAVAVVHDENGNGRLDKNFFGVPSEGYGVSKNHTYAMSSPKWDESKFVHGGKDDTVLSIVLRY
jgi:uncharacterized protein (DUF2141 family)